MGQTAPRRRQPLVPAQDPFWDLVATAKRLRAPGGCPWDRAQTTDSLLPHLIEETWEVFEAAREGRRRALLDELGDVFYTVLTLTLIAQHEGWGDLRTMLSRTRRKMVRRHPHVFGTATAHTPQEAMASWRKVKRTEGAAPSRGKTLRPLLVESWDLLHRHLDAVQALQQTVRVLRRTNGSPARRRARPSPATSRSSRPARGRSRGNRRRETRRSPRR